MNAGVTVPTPEYAAMMSEAETDKERANLRALRTFDEKWTQVYAGIHGAAHPSYEPLREWQQLLDAESCDVLLDEVTGVASSRESAGLPAPVANKLVQLRRADVVVRFSAPRGQEPTRSSAKRPRPSPSAGATLPSPPVTLTGCGVNGGSSVRRPSTRSSSTTSRTVSGTSCVRCSMTGTGGPARLRSGCTTPSIRCRSWDRSRMRGAAISAAVVAGFLSVAVSGIGSPHEARRRRGPPWGSP